MSAQKNLMYNEDFGRFIFMPADEVSAEAVDTYVDTLAKVGVSCALICTAARRAYYQSKVWESFWEGYDPDGPDNQPFLRGHPANEIPGRRACMETMLTWQRLGIDVPARFLSSCRTRGISPWASIRMNDSHGNERPDRGDHPTFWKEHPEYRRVPYRLNRRQDRSFDYAHGEVRDHYQQLIEEQLDRYDMDGLELDFVRHHFYFAIGQELAGCGIMTQWLEGIRKLVDAAAKRRGHPIQLGVRVPSRPETSRRIGLDTVTWAKKGLVDLVVPTSSPTAVSTEFDMPMHLWRDLLSPYNVKLAGCIEPAILRYPGASFDPATPETALGSAAAMLSGGADVVYLFNYFPDRMANKFGWTAQQYQQTLQAMCSLDALQALPRRHIVTYREILAPGELVPRNNNVLLQKWSGEFSQSECPLPQVGSDLIFRLQTGPKPSGRKVQVVIGLEEGQDCSLVPPKMRVNGQPCSLGEGEVGSVLLTYDVPEEALADEEHIIELIANLRHGRYIKVTRVEFVIA